MHNLRLMDPFRTGPFPWARIFGEAVNSLVLSGEYGTLSGFASLPGAGLAAPGTEHFVPLLYTLGAADERDRPRVLNHDYIFGSLLITACLLED